MDIHNRYILRSNAINIIKNCMDGTWLIRKSSIANILYNSNITEIFAITYKQINKINHLLITIYNGKYYISDYKKNDENIYQLIFKKQYTCFNDILSEFRLLRSDEYRI